LDIDFPFTNPIEAVPDLVESNWPDEAFLLKITKSSKVTSKSKP
jgi:hypothetical protein